MLLTVSADGLKHLSALVLEKHEISWNLTYTN